MDHSSIAIFFKKINIAWPISTGPRTANHSYFSLTTSLFYYTSLISSVFLWSTWTSKLGFRSTWPPHSRSALSLCVTDWGSSTPAANLHFKAHADDPNIFTHLWNAILAELFYNKCTGVENSERGTPSWPWGSLPRAGPSQSWNTQQVFRIALNLH